MSRVITLGSTQQAHSKLGTAESWAPLSLCLTASSFSQLTWFKVWKSYLTLVWVVPHAKTQSWSGTSTTVSWEALFYWLKLLWLWGQTLWGESLHNFKLCGLRFSDVSLFCHSGNHTQLLSCNKGHMRGDCKAFKQFTFRWLDMKLPKHTNTENTWYSAPQRVI